MLIILILSRSELFPMHSRRGLGGVHVWSSPKGGGAKWNKAEMPLYGLEGLAMVRDFWVFSLRQGCKGGNLVEVNSFV